MEIGIEFDPSAQKLPRLVPGQLTNKLYLLLILKCIHENIIAGG